VYVLPRGGSAKQDSTGTLITFDSAAVASRFTANNWIQAGLSTDNIRQVSAVGGNSLSVSGAALAVSENDRILLIGNTQPTVTGGSATYTTPATIIRERDDDGADVYTNSVVTTDTNGVAEFYASPNIFDCLIQDANQGNQGIIENLPVGAVEGVSTEYPALFGATVTINGALGVTGTAYFESTVTIDGAIGVTGTAEFGSTVTCLQGVTIADTLSVNYDTVSGASGTAWLASRFGGRAQSTGDNRTLVYASETYNNALVGQWDETTAVYGINQVTNATSDGADAQGLQGEVQFSPTTAVTAAASINGANFTSRYGGTHASAVSVLQRGCFSRFITSVGSTGTITSARGLEVGKANNQGTAEITNYFGLYVSGCSDGFATTINQVANFNGPTDEACDFLITRCPVRIDDNANQANAATDGRWVDIYRNWDGGDTGSVFVGVHMTTKGEGTFTAGDDVTGIRSYVITGDTAGDAENLDMLTGFEAIVDNKSPDETVDDVYGFRASVTMSGGSQTNTMAGLDCTVAVSGGTATNVYSAILRSLTPAATLGSAGHIRMVPVSLATPATTLGALTGAEEGTCMFVTDSNNASNSGLYLFMGSTWYSWTPGGVGAASDT
jgi:hypothetical protein